MQAKVPVHVEVCLKPDVALNNKSSIESAVIQKLKLNPILRDAVLEGDEELSDIVSIKVCGIANRNVSFWQADVCVHIYELSDSPPEKDFLDGEEELSACEQWELPNRLLDGLWESIVVDDDIKSRLVGFCATSMHFSSLMVDPTIISWNKMVLLYGPPGTGKTTLCKALAQKVCIRNSAQYPSGGVLLEINSHSLFSKWFSESGKLVMKLFDHVDEIASDDECFVCILIDEVESIASSRATASADGDPSDAIRAVNAVLTSLDTLRRRKNILVLCTSNMMDGIDAAFKDRCDMMVYMGPPNLAARYQILHSTLSELMNKSIIYPKKSIAEKYTPTAGVEMGCASSTSEGVPDMSNVPKSTEQLLYEICWLAEGYSGRSLRKLPIKAHAYYLQKPKVTILEFLNALMALVQLERNQESSSSQDSDETEKKRGRL